MSRVPTRGPTGQDVATAHPEVEFALVLSRTIESIRNDPEQLRSAVYELARQKLQEQFAQENPSETKRLTTALEVAIQGVEDHFKKNPAQQPARLGVDHRQSRSPPLLPPDVSQLRSVAVLGPADTSTVDDIYEEDLSPRTTPDMSSSRPRRLSQNFAVLGRYLILFAVFAVVVWMAQQYAGLAGVTKSPPPTALPKSTEPAKPSQTAAVEASPPRPEAAPVNPLLPTAFGIYAVSGGRLFELTPLRGRVPDMRVAVSAAINTPSQTIVPDGDLKFVVFRRDFANAAPDYAEVRIVARISQAITFDAAGKPVVADAEDNWVVRNIAFPFRTAPIKENAEMFEIQNREAGAVLSPGRYALVLKGQAYDFLVEGKVTDSRQCLERLAASNGTFFSECRKP